MIENIADTVIEFIRTQEAADRLYEKCEFADSIEEIARFHTEARKLQRKADKLLSKYLSLRRSSRAT